MAELTSVYEGYARTPPPPATVGTPASTIQGRPMKMKSVAQQMAEEGLRIAKHDPLSAITLANARRGRREPKEGTVFTTTALKRKEKPAPAPAPKPKPKPKPIDARYEADISYRSPIRPPPLPHKEASSPRVAFEPTGIRRKEKKPISA